MKPNCDDCPYVSEGKVILAEIQKDIKTLCRKLDGIATSIHELESLKERIVRLEERWKLIGIIAGVLASAITGLVIKLF